MNSPAEELVSRLDGLLQQLSPAERSRLCRDIARQLRASQAKRVAAQQNPDGSAFEPRKPQQSLRARKGKVRRRMFAKLTSTRWLRAKSNSSEAVVQFIGSANRLATVHQFGLRDRVNRRGDIKADYPERQLLGFASADIDAIERAIMDHLSTR